MESFVEAAKVGDVAPGETLLVEIGGQAILLVNVDGELYAIDNECTHSGCDLSDGSLDGDTLECECHGSRFNVTTGAVENPPATEDVATYAVRLDGDTVLVGPE